MWYVRGEPELHETLAQNNHNHNHHNNRVLCCTFKIFSNIIVLHLEGSVLKSFNYSTFLLVLIVCGFSLECGVEATQEETARTNLAGKAVPI